MRIRKLLYFRGWTLSIGHKVFLTLTANEMGRWYIVAIYAKRDDDIRIVFPKH